MADSQCLYLRNGNIWTGDPICPRAESMIIRNGKIEALGSTAQLDASPCAADAVVYELDNVSVIPGFSDSHIHVLTSAKAMHSLDLSSASSLDDVISRLKKKASSVSPESWIYGTMLNENGWERPLLPTAKEIDKAGIPNPVLLHRICTHATVANSQALFLAGIRALNLANIERDPSGEPTGILYDDAQLPAYEVMKKDLYTRDTLIDYLDEYLRHAASFGLTTLHTCSAESLGMGEELFLYEKMYEVGNLSCRVYCVHDALSIPPMGPRIGNDFVRFEGFKVFIDGAIGSRTAAMSVPYHDDPSTAGILLHEFDELCEKIDEAARRHDHILVHAIGDRAIGQQLDAIEKVCAKRGEPEHPYLLNHVEICTPELIERMRRLPVACVIQPTYVYSDIDMVPERLGAMERHACVWKSLIDAGIALCGSSDAPIEALNPMYGIWALVDRTSWDGKRTWHEDQKLSLEQALQIYTVNPAKAYSTWNWNGSLSVGKAADVVVLDRNIFNIPTSELRNVKVLNTLLAGRSVYGSISRWT
ncbi:amidohydrolase [Cloacibacillus evryensis]|uniref:Amidohydrolase n=1 Tax=Cloacibacillus evryensis TaxID=508460 RepID=A0AAW5K287_9BACT|nr:amidohydrolase [Cloacibacillus evryensis]EHL64462.1 hypothetical protein HMPREF1006_00747 [Synergistes sp. 3_1_syn1]MCQ4813909.1 amidohydrolase [Cloacibacillus evryensis]